MSSELILFELDRGMNNGGGFFSVFFFLCNAYLRAAQEKIPMFISHNDWTYTHTHGWHDYFTTLELSSLQSGGVRTRHMAVSEQREFPLAMYTECISAIFQLRPHLIENANRIIESLGPRYTAVFVRRGDKSRETKDISVDKIISTIHLDDSPLFVQSDDFTVVEEFRSRLPRHRIVSTVFPYKRGSYHSKQFRAECNRKEKGSSWDAKTREEIRAETEEMLVGMYICAHATECWTDKTSNVGRFLALWSPDTTRIYPDGTRVNLTLTAHPAFGFDG